MKKSGILILFILLLLSCNNKEPGNTFTIEGNTGVPNGAVYLYGTDSRYEHADSTVCDESGFFRLSIHTDTITPLALVTPDLRYVPVYGEPNIKAELQRDTILKNGWCVNGGATQALHDSISRVLDKCFGVKNLHATIDSFIIKNPVSDVNMEIVRRYMTESSDIDSKAIRSFISHLGGIIKDHKFFTTLKERTDSKVSNVEHRSFPSFSYTTTDSTEFTQTELLKKYTLVTIWATWNKESCERIRDLSHLQDSIESKSFDLLNISFDHDSTAWRKFIDEDSITGNNVIESKMFGSAIAKQFNIKSLPFTMLVSPYQRILKYNVKMEGITAYMDSLTRKYDKEQEKKKEKEKKTNKKR
ncbi:MAG: thioredoxin family protein [Bacteroidaceae bacterium]|nr:thioredoxin family protein [Bacteroidaceae bacterium]